MGDTVLLTGGAGFLGRHLLRELRAAGARVRALSRRAQTDEVLAQLGAEPVRGDLDDGESLRGATQGVDAVFHCAADTNTWAKRNAAQWRTNVDGTQALVAAAKAAGARMLVHTSSVSAYSHLVKGTLREDVAQRGQDSWIYYERSKHAAEQAVRASGLPFLVFQPAHILGPGDTHNWSRLFVLVDRRALPGVPPGSGSFADVREIARAQVRGWRDGRAGESFLLGGEHASFLELLAKVGERLGQPVPRRAMPAPLLRVYARVQVLLAAFSGKEPKVTPEGAVFTSKHLRVDSGKAIRELGYRETPLDTLLDDTLAWLQAEGMLLHAPRKVGSKP
jgi:nucleoside-diphosphate-sugar epimerase